MDRLSAPIRGHENNAGEGNAGAGPGVVPLRTEAAQFARPVMSVTQPARRFAVIRPYSERIRARVFSVLADHGYRLADGMVVPRGTADSDAAAFASAAEVDLLLVPFNVHEDEESNLVDGIGVLINDGFTDREIPILMPVSEYSYHASFQRRFERLTQDRPGLAGRVIVVREGSIDAPELREDLARLES